MTHTGTHIVFPIFDRMTHLDFIGPHTVFAGVPDAHITVASADGRNVEALGLTFANLADLRRIEACDVLCVPGGSGVADIIANESFIRDIARLGGAATYVTSVCTGSLILGAAGLLRGKRATSHWAARHLLAEVGAIYTEGRVVRDGNVITGGGVTAGIDFGLFVVAEIFGRDVAEALELRLEYAPAPLFGVGAPELAPPELVSRVRTALAPSIDRQAHAIEEAGRRATTG